jgi:hypothetical protein
MYFYRDGTKTDAHGRKIGVAGRMQSMSVATTSSLEKSLSDVEPEDSSVNTENDFNAETSNEPSIVIQSDVGVSRLSPSKHALSVPRG